MVAWLVPAIWLGTAITSVIGIWQVKQPVAQTGFFASIPFMGWIVAALILIVILRSRR